MSEIEPTVDPVCSVLAALRARGDAIDREAADVIDRLMIEVESWRTAREDLAAANKRLRETLEVAIRHIDMAALRVSHPKDAALIERMGG